MFDRVKQTLRNRVSCKQGASQHRRPTLIKFF
jgi:hypothetical protein